MNIVVLLDLTFGNDQITKMLILEVKGYCKLQLNQNQ